MYSVSGLLRVKSPGQSIMSREDGHARNVAGAESQREDSHESIFRWSGFHPFLGRPFGNRRTSLISLINVDWRFLSVALHPLQSSGPSCIPNAGRISKRDRRDATVDSSF